MKNMVKIKIVKASDIDTRCMSPLRYVRDCKGCERKNCKIDKREKMKMEVRNETDKKLYVNLCRTMLGNLYLHIDDKKSKHIPILVKPNYYKTITEEEVAG